LGDEVKGALENKKAHALGARAAIDKYFFNF
jgi:hypothetical protein